MPPPRRPSKAEIEEWALGVLLEHLRGTGASIEVVGRPDSTTRVKRAPDFEIHVDGRLVAVEVTHLDRSGHDRAIGNAFTKALESLVAEDVAQRGRGIVVINLYVGARRHGGRLNA